MWKDNKKMYIWGTGYIEDLFERVVLLNKPLEIDGYIDTYKSGFYRGKKVFGLDELDLNQVFIVVAVRDYRPIEKKLNDLGLRYGESFICISKKYSFDELRMQKYDSMNRIRGEFNIESSEISECSEIEVGEGTLFGNNVRVVLSEFSKLIIGESCLVEDDVCIKCEKNSVIVIGENTKIRKGSEVISYEKSIVSVASECVIPTKLIVSDNSYYAMGNKTDFDDNTNVKVLNKSRVIIGDDSMFSYNICIRGEDGHPLRDLKNGGVIKRPKETIIGNHVWVGMGSMILPGADVGSGAVIGAGSIVNKKFMPNVEIVGAPARVVREQVSWDRFFEK